MRRYLRTLAAVSAGVALFGTFVHAANDDALARALKNQDRATATALLRRQKPSVNVSLPDGSTALHWAVQWQDAEMVNALLTAGARVGATDEYGVMPLWLAAVNGDAAILRALLDAGADPNASLPSGETVLMATARTGEIETVNALLDRGTPVNQVQAETGYTALMWAAAEGHVDVVRGLLERGADIRARSKQGYTPFLLAARNPDVELSKALLDAGASVNEASTNGTTALIVATIRSNTGLARFLIERGADVNAGPGFTPLHWASGYFGNTGVNGRAGLKDDDSEWSRIEGFEGEEKREFVKLLLDHQADVNARADVPPNSGVRDARTAAINFTLGIKTEPVKYGATPFWLAARAADVDVMRLLLNHGADASVATGRNVTPLMAAAGVGAGAGSNGIPESRALEAVQICLGAGNDINAANVDGETPLHGAAYRTPQPAERLIELLVRNGAMLNLKNKRGWTPLAIVEGLYFNGTYTLSKAAAELLLKMGAEPTPEGSVDRQVATFNIGVINR